MSTYATVVAYSANDWDTSLTLKWECQPCSMEGGWCYDSLGNNILVERLAQRHNNEHHKEGAS